MGFPFCGRFLRLAGALFPVCGKFLRLAGTAGRAVFRRLATRADAVLNNLRGDQPEKLGLTYAALRDANPRIVCAHLSAYGRDNERKGWPGYDYLMQAEAGYLHLTGEPGTPGDPLRRERCVHRCADDGVGVAETESRRV